MTLKLVFLSPTAATDEIKAVLTTPLYENLICYIQGSVVSEPNMDRAQLRDAAAVFLLSDKSDGEDDLNVFRAWAVHKYAPNVPLYLYTNRGDLEMFYSSIVSTVLVADEIKQVMLGYNCLYRGVSTLIMNLITNRSVVLRLCTSHLRSSSRAEDSQPLKRCKHMWLTQYSDGSGCEIYSDLVNLCFVGYPMNEVSAVRAVLPFRPLHTLTMLTVHAHACTQFLFKEYQIIFFAVRARVPTRRLHRFMRRNGLDASFGHLVLNPGASYVMKEGDECFFMAQNVGEVQEVRKLTPEVFAQLLRTNNHGISRKVAEAAHDFSAAGSATDMLLERLGPIAAKPPQHYCADLVPDMDRMFHHTIDNCRIARPEGPFVSERTPWCHLLCEPPAELASVTLQSAEHLEGHIIVLNSDWNVFSFVCTVRSAQLSAGQVRPVVFFAGELPSQDDFCMLAPFPAVYFMQGNHRVMRDLQRLNLTAAARVVIFTHRSSEYGEFPDVQGVLPKHLIANAIDDMRKHHHAPEPSDEAKSSLHNPFVTVELAQRSSIQFMDKAQPHKKSKRWLTDAGAKTLNAIFSPAFASGQALVTSLLDIILFQTYFNNHLLDIVKLLCGMRCHNDLVVDRELGIRSSYLCYIDVPEGYAVRATQALVVVRG